MRIPILISAALLVSACGGKNAADNAAVGEENGASETIVTNDVTAIDAATGEAANMAADVNYTLDESNLENGANTANATAPRKSARKVVKPAATIANATAASSPQNSL